MNKTKDTILVIDDVQKIFDGFKSKFCNANNNDFIVKFVNVKATQSKKTIISNIVKEFQEHNVTYIISDRGFAKIEDDTSAGVVRRISDRIDFQNIDDIIGCVISQLSTEEIKKINQYIIYSYDPFSKTIRRDFRNLRKKILEQIVEGREEINSTTVKDKIKTIETSTIYRRPGKTGIYPDGYSSRCTLGSHEACTFYGELLADVLIDVIKHKNKNSDRIDPYAYSKPQNYEMLKQIRSLEDLVGNEDLSIGSVSCFGDIYGEDEYLVDVPYKSYYKKINEEIKDKEFSKIFYTENKKDYAKYEYVFFNYVVYEGDKLLLKDTELSSGLKMEKAVCEKWLPLLHSSVFYCEEDVWKNDLYKCNSKSEKDPVSIVTLLFSISRLNEDDFHGTYNFTLYSESPHAKYASMEQLAKENYAPLLESKLLELILPFKSKETKKQTTKAVISDIINRNQAHHIISHVSHRATLDKVLERLGNNLDNQKAKFLSCEKNYLAILDLLNRLNRYRDERGEYLTYLSSFSSPASANLFQDVIRPFVENTLLMDNIAANENLNYVKDTKGNLSSNKLQLKVRIKSGDKDTCESFYATYYDLNENPLYCSENLPYLRQYDDKGEHPYNNVKLTHQDIEVSLPGTLGKHALYSILENFIRNSAKHGGPQKKHGLEIILLLSDDDDDKDNITVTLTDNCSVFDDGNKVEKFNKSIKANILNRKDLGLIDMKVNACLLWGKELNDENCKMALTALLHDDKLAYKFKIAKPKKAVFIGDFADKKKHMGGFYYYGTLEDYSNEDISKSFEFAVLENKIYNELMSKLKVESNGKSGGNKEFEDALKTFSELPARLLIKSKVTCSPNIEELYEAWLKKLRGDINATVHLYFQQKCTDELTKKFKGKYEEQDCLKVDSVEDLKKEEKRWDDEKNVLFDRHGDLIAKFPTNKSFVSSDQSWILIDKNNPDLDYISQYNIEKENNLLQYELEEAGLLKVLVIDERVAEQSVRSMKSESDIVKFEDENRTDFHKLRCKNDCTDLTLFDVAWAANVFIATHLNGKPLKQKIDLEYEHALDTIFNEGEICFKTNILSRINGAKFCSSANKWKKDGKEIKAECSTIELKPDVMIIHRTKLKDLLENHPNFVRELLSKNIKMTLVVTTGSGTTHGIHGHYKILPFSTLNRLILGKRINKLQLSKTLLQLTKNKA